MGLSEGCESSGFWKWEDDENVLVDFLRDSFFLKKTAACTNPTTTRDQMKIFVFKYSLTSVRKREGVFSLSRTKCFAKCHPGFRRGPTFCCGTYASRAITDTGCRYAATCFRDERVKLPPDHRPRPWLSVVIVRTMSKTEKRNLVFCLLHQMPHSAKKNAYSIYISNV